MRAVISSVGTTQHPLLLMPSLPAVMHFIRASSLRPGGTPGIWPAWLRRFGMEQTSADRIMIDRFVFIEHG